jgi:hypothetical protein
MLVHLFDMDRRRRHWWNGHWGRLARRDLVLYEEIHGGWLLEAREGGVEGDSRWFRPPSEEDALQIADELMSDPSDQWRELPVSTTPARPGNE